MENNNNDNNPYNVKEGESKGHLMLGGMIILLNLVFITCLLLYFFWIEFEWLIWSIKQYIIFLLLWIGLLT